MSESKFCKKCKKNKNLNDFYKVGGKQSHLYRSYCKKCTIEMGSTKKAKQTKQAWRVKTRYNLDIKEYNQMFVDCDNKCMICGIDNKEVTRRLCVDLGGRRIIKKGLLCSPCNSLIGYAHENKEKLYKAIEYLDKFEKPDLKSVI